MLLLPKSSLWLRQAAIPQQGTSELQQGEIVFALLLIAHQQATAFREPPQRAFNYPAACRVLFRSVLIERLRATRPDMPSIAMLFDRGLTWSIVVAAIQT